MSQFDPDVEDFIGNGTVASVGIGGRVIGSEAFEGASYTSREMMAWTPGTHSADRAILPNKAVADARNHDTLRNDGYIQGAANLQKDTIVGSSYMASLRPNSLVLFGKEDTDWEDEYSEEVETKFQLWAESPDNWVDASRINNFTGLIRLAVGVFVPTGEVLATVEWRRDWEGYRPYGTCIQMVDTDRLSNPRNVNTALLKRTFGGIEQDEFGAPQAYWIRDAHQANGVLPSSMTWTRSPRYKPWGRIQVIHVFEQIRVHQSRGMAQMVAALKEMKQTKRFRDVVLQNAVLNATFAATIESELPSEQIFASLGASPDPAQVEEVINNYMGSYLTQASQYMGGSKSMMLDGVRVPHLLPGTKLQLRPAGNGGPLGSEFEESLLRHIAASLDVSYEELSRDFSKTNYSGFKGALAVTQRSMNAKKKFIADRMANYIFGCWFEEAFNKGEFETLKRRKKIDIYEGLNKQLLTNADWIGASFGQIDELKETQAAVLRVNAGMSTLQIENARLGRDWRQTFKQLKREKAWKDEYEILQVAPDSQNMMNATSDAGNAEGQNTTQDQ